MILIRCDAGPELGFGHLMRCRQLAAALAGRGHTVGLFGPPEAYRTDEDADIFSLWRPAPAWRDSRTDAAALLEYGQAAGARAYVLDDFRVDADYQAALHAAGVRWMQFAPSADAPIFADLVYAAHPAADPAAFRAALQKPDAEALVGPRYALLRAAFRDLARETRAHVETVLVTFGGGSDRGAIKAVLEILLPAAPQTCRFVIASGLNNPANDALAAWTAGRARVVLRTGVSDMAGAMQAADLAVMAPGTSSLEAAAAQLPMILVTIADNQRAPAQGWAQRGAALDLGWLSSLEPAALRGAFTRLQPAAERARMSAAQQNAGVDGRGADRVCDAIERRLLC